MKNTKAAMVILLTALTILAAVPTFAQAPPPDAPPASQAPPQSQAPPPYFPPAQLDQMVARVALYPDPLLAQIFAAATYPDQIPDAARWADQHRYLTGQGLADAIQAAQLPWDPSIQALLPFPSVLDMMASDMGWTTDMGNAFLAQQQDVMDAVQRERRRAYDYGYLRSNPQVVVGAGPFITIAPVNPAFMVVPYYNPAVVFVAPRAGFVVGSAIRFNFGVAIGPAFRPWGWGTGFARFDWGGHAVFVNNARWGRTWVNRAVYVHPYPEVRRVAVAPRPAEVREAHPQPVARERQAAKDNRKEKEKREDRRDDR